MKENKILFIFTVLLLIFSTTTLFSSPKCKAIYGTGNKKITIATGSPGELGLLKELVNNFSKNKNLSVCWVKAGSGKSLNLLKQKKVDIVMVHAPKAEKEAVKEGWAKKHTLIGANEFVIVGPINDPAGIADAKTAIEAYKKIEKNKSIFMSRGDNSGTNKRELQIWESANISPNGNWYKITHQFMMATLKKANQLKGYFMVDSSTWIVGKKKMNNLKLLFKGDPVLDNVYHALISNIFVGNSIPTQFITFLVSQKGQSIIINYGKNKYGEPLYKGANKADK